MGKIEQNKEKKRRAILEAAKSIFLTEGYVHTSMDKVAATANVTKQTVYRYFPSKVDLFQNTLREMGKQTDEDLVVYLSNSDSKQALEDFALEFVKFHMSKEHIGTTKLLIAESSQAPEILETFQSVGPDALKVMLSRFFAERFELEESEQLIELWISMLLSLRMNVLMGGDMPSTAQIHSHVLAANKMLFSSIG